MVSSRILAIPYETIFIAQLPEETRKIIREDLRQYAKEQGIRLEWDREAMDYTAMSRRFCDIDEIYSRTNLHFCKEGQDVEPYKRSMQRNVVLQLAVDDTVDLCSKAARVGLTVSELLENFIADLVGSDTRSNGSDERMYAEQWFERCWFSFEPEQTFLKYLIEWGIVDEVIEKWNDLQDLKEEQLDEYDEEWREELSDELNEIFCEYKEDCQKPVDVSLEAGMEKVLKWDMEKQALLKGNVIDRTIER